MCISGVRQTVKEEKAGRGEVDIRRWLKMAMMLSTALNRWRSPDQEECVGGSGGKQGGCLSKTDGETDVVEEGKGKYP